ncbi:ubiquinol-cytochrome c reductase iron-sulfur subunit [Nocardioides sp. SYSU D00038]|uniref:QcrA and Rieske domain-containing protein n=1 Tax=Nocardioides sp. SYSU D00038 TaxID=2812554 RepID=UPI001967C02D|nr:Rieske (2Fe-2S) protein [Nocardioides sp. SYSU D00038]
MTERLDLISRRSLTGGLVTAGLGLPLLAACGGDDAGPETAPSGGGSSSGTSTPDAAPSPGTGAAAPGLVGTSEIEVGGGTILPDEGLVITQPTEGAFKGFSSTCTHQGCPVTEIAEGSINCTCHGSSFSIEDGAPTAGPATEPLEEIPLKVEGDQISLA